MDARKLTGNEFELINIIYEVQLKHFNGYDKPTARYKALADRCMFEKVEPTINDLVRDQLLYKMAHNYRGKLSWYVRLTNKGRLAALAHQQARRITQAKQLGDPVQTRIFDDESSSLVGAVVMWKTPDGTNTHTGTVVCEVPALGPSDMTLADYVAKTGLDLAKYHLCNVKALTNRPQIKLRKTVSYLVECDRGPGLKPALYWPLAVNYEGK